MKFLSIEPANNTNAEGIIECIKTAFDWIGIFDFQKRIMGLSVDGTSVNTGVRNGVGVFTRGADLGWVCTLISPQFDFWYCKYDYGGSFIKSWHVGIHGRLARILD